MWFLEASCVFFGFKDTDLNFGARRLAVNMLGRWEALKTGERFGIKFEKMGLPSWSSG